MGMLATRSVWEVGRSREPPGVLRHAAFAAGAIRRRWRLLAAVAASLLAVTGLALRALPPSYEATTRVVFRPSPVLHLRADRERDGSPMRGADEIVWRAENRRKMIVATGALAEFEARRSPLLRLKDRIFEKLRGPRTEDQKIDGLVGMLETRLSIWTESGDVLAIRVRWPDARTAARLADAARVSFLDARYAVEVQAVEKLVAILEEHAAGIAARADRQVAQLALLSDAERDRILSVDALDPARMRPAVPRELKLLQDELAEKERVLSGMEDSRRMQLAALNTRLVEERTEYSDAHPEVVGLLQKIGSLETESDDMAKLRREHRNLRNTVNELTGEVEERGPGAREEREERAFLPSLRARGANASHNRLALAAAEVESARSRIQALRIEADTARAAFPLRYVVVQPALVPKAPVSPDPLPVMLAALLDALLLGALAAVLAEVRHGAVRSRWQLEAALGGGAPVVEVRLS